METHYPEEIFQYCPYCGISEWKSKAYPVMLCSRCDFVFYLNVASAVCALIEDTQGRLLLTERAKDPAQGMLDLPGGFVDRQETAEAAIQREIQEELNLSVHNLQYFTSFPNRYHYQGITYCTLDLAFRCAIDNLDSLNAGDDVSGIRWIPCQDIQIEWIGLESIQTIVKTYLHSKKWKLK